MSTVNSSWWEVTLIGKVWSDELEEGKRHIGVVCDAQYEDSSASRFLLRILWLLLVRLLIPEPHYSLLPQCIHTHCLLLYSQGCQLLPIPARYRSVP